VYTRLNTSIKKGLVSPSNSPYVLSNWPNIQEGCELLCDGDKEPKLYSEFFSTDFLQIV
jgi:hypothetical protein